jgi:POTRA domain-containing FtsQ-type protein
VAKGAWMPAGKPRTSVAALRARTRPSVRTDVARLVPSGRSLLVGIALLVSCLGAYAGARETSLFAVRTIDVRGADADVSAETRAALRGELGISLLKVDRAELERRLAAIPTIHSATLDRAFPSTLVVTVRPEQAVAVVRRGSEGWLVSARARVLRPVEQGTFRVLPRIWLGKKASVEVGGTLAPGDGGTAAAALGPLTGSAFAQRVLLVKAQGAELTLVLRTGVELRLGDPGDLRLKLVIGQRILSRYGAEAGRGSYVDVSVPERPVANFNPQLGG